MNTTSNVDTNVNCNITLQDISSPKSSSKVNLENVTVLNMASKSEQIDSIVSPEFVKEQEQQLQFNQTQKQQTAMASQLSADVPGITEEDIRWSITLEDLHRRNLNIPDEYYHQEPKESRAPIPEYNLPRHTSHDLKIKKKPAVAAAGKSPSAHHRKGWGGSAEALNITVKGKADSQSCYDHEDDISEDIVDNDDNVGGEETDTSLHLKLDSSQEKVPVGLSAPKITIGQPLKSA